MRTSYFVFLLTLFANVVIGQRFYPQTNYSNLNPLTTSVPLLRVPSDSRQLAMGQTGVVPGGDQPWAFARSNPALLVRDERYVGLNVSFMPWLSSLIPEMGIVSIQQAASIGDRHAIGMAFRYFSFGEITFTDQSGQPSYSFRPHELSLQGNYAFKVSDYFSTGIGFKYYYSNLTGGASMNGRETYPGTGVAVDLGAAYDRTFEPSENAELLISGGFSVVNVGSKVSYVEGSQKDFIPSELAFGGSVGVRIHLGDFSISERVVLSCSKLLVPTPPRYATNLDGVVLRDSNDDPVIAAGYDPDIPVAQALYQSFYDAPDGFKEEVAEVVFHGGNEIIIQYKENISLALRQGFLLEDHNKGGRKLITMGAGVNCYGINLDAGAWLAGSAALKHTWFVSTGYTYTFGERAS